MTGSGDEGTHFSPADNDNNGSNSSSPALVAKLTTQRTVQPFAQARKPLGPAPRGGDLPASAVSERALPQAQWVGVATLFWVVALWGSLMGASSCGS